MLQFLKWENYNFIYVLNWIIMKKFLLLAVMAVMGVGVSARDVVTTDMSQLPEAARVLIQKHFQKYKIAYIKIDNEPFGKKEYDVLFKGGQEIAFSQNGMWEDIDCKRDTVPAALVPQYVRDYVKKEYPDAFVNKIERKRRGGVEIDLNNGFSLEFNAKGKLVDVDY